jgi:hypothetical protein
MWRLFRNLEVYSRVLYNASDLFLTRNHAVESLCMNFISLCVIIIIQGINF